jgi:CubicO group peptidase (beta-lactamase class C family)
MNDQMTLDRRALLAGLTALTAPSMVFAKGGANYAAIHAFLDDYVGSGKLASCVVAITKPGVEPVYISKGTLATDTPIKAGPDSIFRVYSMSKPITGATFMTLVEKGKLSLNQPISDILPEFKDQRVMVDNKLENTRPVKSPILMRHLVTHTSGLSYGINRGVLAEAYNAYGLGAGGRAVAAGLVRPTDKWPPARDLETFGRRLATMPLDFDPGTKWQYSVGLDLMGLIIQRASGMGFYDYMKQVILDPLGMHDTDFVVPASKQNRLTSVYTGESGKLVVNDDRNSSPFSRDRDLPSGGGGLLQRRRAGQNPRAEGRKRAGGAHQPDGSGHRPDQHLRRRRQRLWCRHAGPGQAQRRHRRTGRRLWLGRCGRHHHVGRPGQQVECRRHDPDPRRPHQHPPALARGGL